VERLSLRETAMHGGKVIVGLMKAAKISSKELMRNHPPFPITISTIAVVPIIHKVRLDP
jgi:hypothetical protein